MSDGGFPNWCVRIADWFVPKNRCVYCWWVRGGLAHALVWDLLVGNLLATLYPSAAWFLRGVVLAALILLYRYDRFEKVESDGEDSEEEKREVPSDD